VTVNCKVYRSTIALYYFKLPLVSNSVCKVTINPIIQSISSLIITTLRRDNISSHLSYMSNIYHLYFITLTTLDDLYNALNSCLCVVIDCFSITDLNYNCNMECSLCRLIRRPEHLIGRHCGISRQTEGHSFGDHLISKSVSVTSSSVIEASIVLCSVCA
jgi:hypothetical protein